FPSLAEQLGGRGLIETGFAFTPENANSLEQAQRPKSVGIGRVFPRLERHLHMRLRREIVDLVGLCFLHDTDDIGRIRDIAVMQMESDTLFVRVMNEVVDALGIEGRRAALHAVNNVALGKKKFGKIGAILPGHAGNEGHLARWSSHHCSTPAPAVSCSARTMRATISGILTVGRQSSICAALVGSQSEYMMQLERTREGS